MNALTHKKNYLTATISMILGTSVVPVVAQEVEDNVENVEKIEVRGIRGSLVRAQDMKREADGVLDAISAEEMGKFPDTNLAEALQRITGVTISRANGEGSKITVRGLGPEYNLVTLNGRQMPGTGYTRSYDLANLASEGVSALEVQKTARADNPSGGMGATVNIVTAKPLQNPGLQYAVSAKGMHDSSVVEGDDVTPELSALFSNTFADDKIGISLSVSHQLRNFQQQRANIDGWRCDGCEAGGELTTLAIPTDLPDSAVVDPRPLDDEGNRIGPHFFPQNTGYTFNNVERTRDTGHLTLQFAPTENLTMTLDYLTTEVVAAQESMSFGVWFNFGGNINSYELDDNGTVVKFNEANNDYAHTLRRGTTKVEADSVGLNIDWTVNDDLKMSFDYHDSKQEIDDGADPGSNNNGFIIIGPNNLTSKTYDYTAGEVPQVELFWPNNAAEANVADFDSQFGQFFRNTGESQVEQAQIDIEWFEPLGLNIGTIRFGVAYTDQNIGGMSGFSGNQGVVGYEGVQALLPDGLFTRQDTGDFLTEVEGGGSDFITDYYYTFDYNDMISRHIDYYGDGFKADAFAQGISSESYVREETVSFYLQSDMEFDVFDYPARLALGVRAEQTDVTSTVRQRQEDKVVWQSSTEWSLLFKDIENDFVVTTGQHDVILPTADFAVELTDDLMARVSIGKSIARAPLGSLAGVRSLSPTPKPGARTGGAGNTDLQPFESINYDLSLEYYYAEGSYMSIGYFEKHVTNWIESIPNTITVDGIRDIIGGPRYVQAVSALEAAGEQATVEAIYNQIIASGGGNADGQIEQRDEDPLMEWSVTQPDNGDFEAVIDGVEIALTHLFGDSGFGVGINATFVGTNAEAVRTDLTDRNFYLDGVGDSGNAQIFYEDDIFSAKLVYAVRPEYYLGRGQAGGSAEAPYQFFNDFEQLDFSASYRATDNLTFMLEGINLTNEVESVNGRYQNQFLSAAQYGTRYLIGARYNF